MIVTPFAAKKIKQMSETHMLRVSVDGGGCAGFRYSYTLDTQINPDDTVLAKDTAQVVLDPISLTMLNNCILDYIETLGSAGFKIKNPHANSVCGCGSSFST